MSDIIANKYGDRSSMPQYPTMMKKINILPQLHKLGLMKQWENPDNTVSPSSVVAEVIYAAVTDGTNQLRYRAGDDANFLLDSRKKITDWEFFEMMSNQLGK